MKRARTASAAAPAASPTAAWKLLLAGTSHADSIVRCDAARLLGDLRDPRAVPALSRLLQADRHLTKITAVYALGAIGERKAAPVLLAIAKDPGVFRFPGMHYHDMIRLAAATELAHWDDAAGVVAVNDLLRLKGMPAMLELAPAILGPPPTAALAKLRAYLSLPFVLGFHQGRPSASNHFFVVRNLAFFRAPEARTQLIADLDHYSRYVRPEAAASLLAQDPSPTSVRLVAGRAKKERTAFGRLRFAQLLHQHAAGDARAAVAKGLKDRDAFVRATALDTAAALQLEDFAPTAVSLLADADFYVRICAVAAIEAVAKDQAATLLSPLLADPHPRVAIQAAKSLIAAAG